MGTFGEDSQIDLDTGNVFLHVWGGGGGGVFTQERFSNFGNDRFFKQRNYRKNLVSKEEYYRQHNP